MQISGLGRRGPPFEAPPWHRRSRRYAGATLYCEPRAARARAIGGTESETRINVRH